MTDTDQVNSSDGIIRFYRIKAIVILAIMLIGVIVLFTMLQAIRMTEGRLRQEENNVRFFSSTLTKLNNNNREIGNLEDNFNENNQIALDDLVKAYSGNNYKEMEALSVEEQSNMLLYGTYTMEDCLWLLVVNGDGDILVSNYMENIGKNVVRDRPEQFTTKSFQALRDGKEDYLVVDNPYYGKDEGMGRKMYCYCRPIPGSRESDGIKYFFLGFDSIILDKAQEAMDDLSNWVTGTTIGNNGSVLIVNGTSDTVIFGSLSNTDQTGVSASALGLEKEALSDRYTGVQELEGEKYYISVRSYSSELYGNNSFIIAAIPVRSIYGVSASVSLWTICLFLIFTFIILAYSSYLRSELMKKGEDLKKIRIFKGKKREYYLSRTLALKILPIVFAATLIVLCAVFYFQMLMKLSDCFAETVSTEEEIRVNVEENASLQEEFKSYYNMQYESRAKLLSYLAELSGDEYYASSEGADSLTLYEDTEAENSRLLKDDYGNPIKVVDVSEKLIELSDLNRIKNIYLLSDRGVTLATSSGYWDFSLSNDPGDQSYEFRNILSGKKSSMVQDPMVSDGGNYTQFVGAEDYYYTCLDENGNTKFVDFNSYLLQSKGEYKGNEITRHRGVLQIEIDPDAGQFIVNSAKPEYVLANTKISNDGFLMAFEYDESKDDYRIFFAQKPDFVGKYAKELDFDDTAFNGEYNGFQSLNGELYLQSIRQAGDYFIATEMPVTYLFRTSITSAGSCTLYTLFIMFIIALFMMIVSNTGEEELYREETNPFEIFAHRKADSKWRRLSTTGKFESVIKNSFVLLGVIFLAAIVFESKRAGSNSAIAYIISGEWDRGVHIFSISACIVLLILTGVLLRVFRQVTSVIAEAFGNRGVTMMRLFCALIELGVIAAVILYCLYLVGIDATRLLASAGIMSVVVGLGAQSLVGDLLAGIFIIMEGSLHVGDYVLIDGVRGRVTEIGLRITRYEDINQNIRVICNNELKSFANMSMKYSIVYYSIPVPYNEDYVRIKSILNEEFLELYEKHRFLKGIPSCHGIEEFSESSVDICVRFVCEENDRLQVQRFMHDQIMRIFMENGITIPFNQLDVHFERELREVIEEKKEEREEKEI